MALDPKVRRRADFFMEEAGRFTGQDRLSDFELSEQDALHTSEAYFLVNEAYKARRLTNAQHRTLPTKVAAITALVTATVNPLRPKGTPNSASPASIYANALFALRLGCNIVQHPIHLQGWIRMQWFCDHLRNDTLDCLDEYISTIGQKTREIGDPFELELPLHDLSRIEGRVAYFDVLEQLKIRA